MSKTKTGNYRWVICALLFFATTLNYLDRTVIGLLKDDIGAQFGWTESDYSNIVVCFQVAYAIGLLGAGWLIDKLGTKLGYFISVCVWSLATIMHGFAKGTFGFAAARSLLGLSEAGNFPAANKTVAEWFPLKERALATGIYNSGSNIGAIVAPVLIPWLLINYGWQAAFYATGALGLLWLVLWVICYGKPSEKKISPAELEYINSDNAAENAIADMMESEDAADDGEADDRARWHERGEDAFLMLSDALKSGSRAAITEASKNAEDELLRRGDAPPRNFYSQYYKAELTKKFVLSAACFCLTLVTLPLSMLRVKHGKLTGFAISLLIYTTRSPLAVLGGFTKMGSWLNFTTLRWMWIDRFFQLMSDQRTPQASPRRIPVASTSLK